MRKPCLLAAAIWMAGCGPEARQAPHARDAPLAPVPVRPFRIADPDLVLLVTGGTHGMLEVCNCAGPMPGGLARRSGLVRSYRAAFPRTFLLDAGDVFWVDPDDLRNEFVLAGYARIGYDAVVLGDQEWAAGADRLGQILDSSGTPALSTTVAARGVDPCTAVLRDLGRARIAILADVPESAFRFISPQRLVDVAFADAGLVARRAEELRREGYTVIVVAHMDGSTLEAAAPAYHADLIIRGHTSRSEPDVARIGDLPVVKVGGSETVGAVAIKLRDGRIADLDYRTELVDVTWPLDGRLIQTYQAYAHAAMRQALDAKRKEGLEYMASEACGHCHRPQYDFWRTTRHARAYATLEKAGRTGDPSCLMCHTTGFGTRSGFYTVQSTPRLANVNCQDCHRFNDLEHRQKGYLFEPVTKDVCETCHTPITDPKFDFAAKLPKVRSPRSPHKPSDSELFRADPPDGGRLP